MIWARPYGFQQCGVGRGIPVTAFPTYTPPSLHRFQPTGRAAAGSASLQPSGPSPSHPSRNYTTRRGSLAASVQRHRLAAATPAPTHPQCGASPSFCAALAQTREPKAHPTPQRRNTEAPAKHNAPTHMPPLCSRGPPLGSRSAPRVLQSPGQTRKRQTHGQARGRSTLGPAAFGFPGAGAGPRRPLPLLPHSAPALSSAAAPPPRFSVARPVFHIILFGLLVVFDWYSGAYVLSCDRFGGSPIAFMVPATFRVVGFSGSRRCPAAVAAALSVVPQFSGLPAFVGCASGVDAAVSAALPSARVFRASSQHPAALAQRSAALVQAVAAGGGLLVVCPAAGQPCPAGVRPGAAFSGGGSGSWASCALAVQHGAAVLVWSSTLPAWLASAGYSPAPGWWYRPAAHAAPTLFG